MHYTERAFFGKISNFNNQQYQKKEKMMESIAQEYIARGIEQGLEQCRQEEKLGIARTMYGPVSLSRGLPDGQD